MNSHPDKENGGDLRAVVEDLTTRLKRVEEQLGIASLPTSVAERKVEPVQDNVLPKQDNEPERESLEFEVGQTWFALIGIVALAIGMGFLLSLPFASLPSWLPSLAGYVASILVFSVAQLSRKSFKVISKYLRGAGILLLFFASIRLFYFGETAALGTNSLLGQSVLILTIGINLILAWRRNSQVLFVMAILTGCGSALAIGSAVFVGVTLTGLAALGVYAQLKRNWRSLTPVVFTALMLTYSIWAIGNPVIGNPLGIVIQGYPIVFSIPLWILVFSYAVMLRPDRTQEDAPVQVGGLLMCGLGYGVFFLHHLLGFESQLIVSQLVMAVVLLGIAFVFWTREKSSFNTFMYAMTGYMALSIALIKWFDSPEVFVALSLQSLIVIATAIYFSSKFIILANCLIFIGIILGYIAVSHGEQGMSIGFGIVALVSARILNWQKERLTLQTEFMRNAYLAIAFAVLPYALFYLAPDKFVAVAWVALSLFYYGLFLFFGNRKYRWMGHSTLLLTALYVVLIGTAKLESHYRIITFLALGSIMIIVSLIFSYIRGKQATNDKPEES